MEIETHTCDYVKSSDLFKGINSNFFTETLGEELGKVASWGNNNKTLIDANSIAWCIGQLDDEDAKVFERVHTWCCDNSDMYVDLEN